MKRRKLKPEGEARIEEVADLRIRAMQEIPTYKALGRELNLAPLYVAQLVSARIREKLKSLTIRVERNDATISLPQEISP